MWGALTRALLNDRSALFRVNSASSSNSAFACTPHPARMVASNMFLSFCLTSFQHRVVGIGSCDKQLFFSPLCFPRLVTLCCSTIYVCMPKLQF